MSARAATQAASYSKGLILAILLDRKELSLRDLVLCFVSCKAFRELMDGRGFCIGTAWLCACLEGGRNPTEILSKLRSARCSLAYERPLSRVNQVKSFLTRYEDHSGDGRWMWAQLLYQEPDGGVLCEGMKKMLWVYKHRLIKQLHKPTGYHPGLCTLKGHSGPVYSVAWSPDGKQLASGSWDETIRIWDVATGKEAMGPLTGHSDCVCSVAWSPDGKLVASGSYDKSIRIWDVATGKEAMGPLMKCSLTGHFFGHVSSVAWSPDGNTVASGSLDGTVRLWDVETGSKKFSLKGHSAAVNSVAFSPDGKYVASGSGELGKTESDNSIRIWDVATGKEAMGPLKGHSDDVNSVAWSPCGNFVASGSDDGTVKIWDALTGSEKCSLKGTIASWQILDPYTEELATKVHQDDPKRSRSGQYIVTANGDMVYIYLANSDGPLEPDGEEPLVCFCSPASVSAVSCMGKLVVVGCEDGQVLFLEAHLLAAG